MTKAASLPTVRGKSSISTWDFADTLHAILKRDAIVGDSGPSRGTTGALAGFAIRSERMRVAKDAKLQAGISAKEADEIEECTFKPTTTSNPYIKAKSRYLNPVVRRGATVENPGLEAEIEQNFSDKLRVYTPLQSADQPTGIGLTPSVLSRLDAAEVFYAAHRLHMADLRHAYMQAADAVHGSGPYPS